MNELNGYHLNEWTIEDLDKSAKFGLPALDNPNDLICGGMVDEDGFMAGAFSSTVKKKQNGINESLLPSIMRVTINDGGGYTTGCLGASLAKKYMDDYHLCAVAKTLIPKHWNPRAGDRDVYFFVKTPYRSTDQDLKFDVLEARGLIPEFEIDAVDPQINSAGINGIDLTKFIAQQIPAIEIPKMVKSGEMKREADALLEKAKEDKKNKGTSTDLAHFQKIYPYSC